MMASQSSKVHDPMYNFDTHYPERLSRLHLHNDSPGSFRKRKSRAQRCGSRYKTQPVTFDEITEVDEEPTNEDKPQGQKLKGQLQAFSRSMDGLLPKTGHDHVQHHFSHSRPGSRKYHRHPDCIPERVEAEGAISPQPQASLKQQSFAVLPDNRVPDGGAKAAASAATSEKPPTSPASPSSSSSHSVEPQASSEAPGSSQSQPSPAIDGDLGLAPANMAPRRQKVTAKAKKRQKTLEEGQGQVS